MEWKPKVANQDMPGEAADRGRSRQRANRSIASCLLALAHFRTPCWSRCFRRAARALFLCLRFDDRRALRVRIEVHDAREGWYQPSDQAKRNRLGRMVDFRRMMAASSQVYRMCHFGCFDGSPGQHASKDSTATGHPVVATFEPDGHWFYDYRTEEFFAGPKLDAPHSHPLGQPVPGPAGTVPSNWQTLLHE